jgi:hypothetical protein
LAELSARRLVTVTSVMSLLLSGSGFRGRKSTEYTLQCTATVGRR